jgi:hypothetical protein
MPQDLTEVKKPIADKGKPRSEGKVLPQEPVDIYATSSKAGKHLGAHGTKHTVHAVLAKQLVDKGAATYEATKKVKLTKKETDALAAKLGHAPTEEEIASAIEEKELAS